MSLDYERVSRDLIRALRGKRSQVAFSRRLGFRSNVVYAWEAGRRWPTASGFLAAAQRVGIKVSTELREFAGPPGWPDDVEVATPAGAAGFLASLRGATPIVEVAARAGRSRFAVARWLKGQAEPRLPDFLRLVSALSLRVLDFVARFVDPATLHSTRQPWRRLESARTLAWASPWAQAVLLALELADYQALPGHDGAWIARRLGLGQAEAEGALRLLQRSGQVAWRGRHLAPVVVQSVDVRRPSSGTQLKEHWSRVGLERLVAGAAGTWTYNLCTVSEEDLAKIQELQRAHYRAVRAIVAESGPPERVVLLNLQVVPLDHI